MDEQEGKKKLTREQMIALSEGGLEELLIKSMLNVHKAGPVNYDNDPVFREYKKREAKGKH